MTEENIIVSAQVIETPSDYNNLGRRGGTYRLVFNGQVFAKRGNRLMCQLVIGKEKVDVLTHKERDKIIFPNEYVNSNDFLYETLLILFGIVIAFKG